MKRFIIAVIVTAALVVAALVMRVWLRTPDDNAINFPPENVSVEFERTNLPLVFINTGNTAISRDTRISATMTIVNNPDGVNFTDTAAHPGQHIDYRGFIGLRYRGHTSFQQPKKPYSVHTLNAPYEKGGKKKAVSLLGMSPDSRWAFLSSHSDKSLMRDLLALRLGRNYLPYAPDGRFCELILDGTYYGVFILCELNTIGKNRLDLDRPGSEGDALTGGYYIEVDHYHDPSFVSDYHPRRSDYTEYNQRPINFVYNWPDFEDLTEVQVNYIQGAVRAMEDALAADNFASPTEGYAKHIDVTSFIDCMLTTEFSHNVDGYRLSTGIYKFRDSVDPRFHATIWDYNLAFGNAGHNESFRTDRWMYLNNDTMIAKGDAYLIPFWWQRLMQDPAYVDRLARRWEQYRSGAYSTEHLMTMIDSMANELTATGAIDRNDEAWNVWGRYVWPNHYVAPDFASEINYLKTWITRRVEFMDREIPRLRIAAGDINGDRAVGSADMTILVGIITGGIPQGVYAGKADLNNDGKVNIYDINALTRLMLD